MRRMKLILVALLVISPFSAKADVVVELTATFDGRIRDVNGLFFGPLIQGETSLFESFLNTGGFDTRIVMEFEISGISDSILSAEIVLPTPLGGVAGTELSVFAYSGNGTIELADAFAGVPAGSFTVNFSGDNTIGVDGGVLQSLLDGGATHFGIMILTPDVGQAFWTDTDDTILSVTVADSAPDTTFSIVIIPDTQMYSESHPEIVDAQMDWIVANEESEDIIYVAHLGDLKDDLKCDNRNNIDQGSGELRTEWEIIDDAFQILDDANISYGVVPGNHDFVEVPDGASTQCPFAECTVSPGGVLSCAGRPLGTDDMLDPPATFNSVMGPSRFDGTIPATAQATYGDSVGLGTTPVIRTGNRAAGNNEDNFSLVEFGDVGFVIINLGYRKGHNGVISGEASVCDSIGNPELSWADDLLKEYPDRIGIVTSHAFMVENNPSHEPGRNQFDDYGSAVHTCLADNPNFMMMTAAHRWGEAWGRNGRTGMQPVHAILSDYQGYNYLMGDGSVPSTAADFENLDGRTGFGDGGYMRIMRFDISTGIVNVETFAPPVKFADDDDVPYTYPPVSGISNMHSDHWHVGLGSGDSRERPGLTSVFTPTYTVRSTDGRIIFNANDSMGQDTASNSCFTFRGYRQGVAEPAVDLTECPITESAP